VGLIILEASSVDVRGKHRDNVLCSYDDSFMPGLKALVEKIHMHGTAAALQLIHIGRLGNPEVTGGRPWAPSPVSILPQYGLPREMNVDDIQYIIRRFSEAAKRAKDAGFDSIEFHGAHGYLLHQFFSPRSNIRTDAYGGTLEKRMHFLLETVEAVRKAVGIDFPLIFRVSAFEGLKDGYVIEDVLILSKRLENVGIDILSISAGTNDDAISAAYSVQPAAIPRGFLAEYSEIIKKDLKIPVIVAGRINSPELAEEILELGKADLIAMGRSLLVDPELPNKARRGDIKDIRRCIACNVCIDKLRREKIVSCLQNAFIGKEKEAKFDVAEKRKKVFVIGSGPAGMEAALIAKKRGHDVTLFEKEKRLGGQLNWAIIPPHKELKLLLDYQAETVEKLGIQVHVGVEVTTEFIKEAKPDVIILATGSRPRIPAIPGMKQKHILTSLEALDNPSQVGKIVVILGGGLVGAETAEFLATLGKKVIMIPHRTIKADVGIASGVNPFVRALLVQRLEKLGVKILYDKMIRKVLKDSVILEGKDGKITKLHYQTFVLAAGAIAVSTYLRDTLREEVAEIYAIGDCVSPRTLDNAIHEGVRTALMI
jgi:2,4-dienoyl-CoA reductase-like NADH-dependent reductase (Old Yellow Enzyme family)/thioredoxin reductase